MGCSCSKELTMEPQIQLSRVVFVRLHPPAPLVASGFDPAPLLAFNAWFRQLSKG